MLGDGGGGDDEAKKRGVGFVDAGFRQIKGRVRILRKEVLGSVIDGTFDSASEAEDMGLIILLHPRSVEIVHGQNHTRLFAPSRPPIPPTPPPAPLPATALIYQHRRLYLLYRKPLV